LAWLTTLVFHLVIQWPRVNTQPRRILAGKAQGREWCLNYILEFQRLADPRSLRPAQWLLGCLQSGQQDRARPALVLMRFLILGLLKPTKYFSSSSSNWHKTSQITHSSSSSNNNNISNSNSIF